ncbi:MAG: outer membrane beta-barrel family protein [Bacteroidota bacterium]
MPIKIHLLTLLFLSFLCTCVRAQTMVVTGRLSTSDGYAPSGNVLALHPGDSSLLKGDFFLDGTFTIDELPQAALLLEFTSLEFADFYHRVEYQGQDTLHLEQLQVPASPVAMETIVVRGRKPVYHQRADGTIEVLVANTTLAASPSTAEILARTPDVQRDEDGVLSVIGKGAATLYLDGQPIAADQLALIVPSNIKKIAVIRNPSARYDASGGAVIEITTLRGRDDGYNLRLQQNVGNSDFGGQQSYTALNLNGNRGRFAATANYALQTGQDRHVKFTTRQRTDPAIFLSSAVNIDWQPELEAFHNYGIGLQYNAPRGGALSLGYTGVSENLGGQTFNTNYLIDNEGIWDFANTISRNEKDRSNSLSFNFDQPLDSLGSKLFLGGQYAHFANRADNPIAERAITPEASYQQDLRSQMALDIDVASVQVDLTKVFSDQHSLEAGLRFGRVTTNADFDFLRPDSEGQPVPDPALSNVYLYTESVLAGYLSNRSQLTPVLSFQAGLRAERTAYSLSLTENDQAPLTDEYLNLFPNASLHWQLPNARSLNLSLSSRIRRPPYQSLNPNPVYQDAYTSIQGNPLLVPEKVYGLELTGKFGANTLKLGYNFVADPLGGGAIRGNTSRSYILKRLNLSQKNSWYAAVSRSITTDWWTSNNTLSLSYTSIKAFELEFAPITPRPQPYFFTDNRFRVGQLFHAELLFWYNGQLREGIFTRYDNANLTLTVEKTFFAKVLQVRLMANDLFNTVRASGDYRLGETDIYFDNKWRSSFVRLLVTVDLGRLQQGRYRNRATGKMEAGRI